MTNYSWHCLNCGVDMAEAGLLESCRTEVTYEATITRSGVMSFGKREVCASCDHDCVLLCRSCKTEVTETQEDRIRRLEWSGLTLVK